MKKILLFFIIIAMMMPWAAFASADISQIGDGNLVRVEGNTATITGGAKLTGARLKAVDLRGGAAVLIAALAAQGTSEITGTELIERGYYDIVGKFKRLGANISNDPSEISTANVN